MVPDRIMTYEEACQTLAKNIWRNGPADVCYCIVPSCYRWPGDPDTDYHLASDTIYDRLKATHYYRKWHEPGRSVLLEFFCADSFGASYDIGHIVHREIVDIS